VSFGSDSPIFYDMIASLGVDRDTAVARADELRRILADVEGLHEPDVGGDCPACHAPAPCLTLQLAHGLVTLEAAFAALREGQTIDLVAAETDRPSPTVPSLKELMAIAPRGVDRFFEALLSDPPPGRRRDTA
jgi:hypothetical protein